MSSTESSEIRELRRAWKAAGGTPASFERAKEELTADHKQAAVETLNDYLRQQHADTGADPRVLFSNLRED